jgi:rhodanese-related sulfurtransferase
MKINLRTVLFLFGVTLIVSGPCALAHTDVTAEQARELIDSTDDLTVVDVREPSEYSGTRGHIPGALNYPLNSGVLLTRYEELPMHSPVLVVCGSGSRSNRAAKFLDSMDFSMVYDMLGGMRAWIWETETGVDSDSKYGGGTGEPNDPYLIYTAEQLNAIGAEPNDWDKSFKLMADIDLDPNLPGNKVFDKAVIAYEHTFDDPESFGGTSFSGQFDGNGYVISNLHIQGSRYLGLFGRLEIGAVISNLGLETADVNGTDILVGSLVGCNWGGDIASCYSSGTVNGNALVGGLVGENLVGSIFSSYSTNVVIGEYFYIGGLVGINSGSISSSHSTSTVSGASSFDVGGFVGSNSGTITESYSTGTVTGYGRVGGLVGVNLVGPATRFEDPEYIGSITASYSTSTVIGDSWYVGGLVGENYGFINSSYSNGTVSGDLFVGGLVGGGFPSRATNCLWDMETSDQVMSIGGTGKTTAEMQRASTFLEAGWDFVGETENGTEDIWSICEGTNYPRLVWQIQAGDFVCPDGITMDDFLFFLKHWLDDNCDLSNGYCQGTDLDQSGAVDTDDLEIFFENWLAEK